MTGRFRRWILLALVMAGCSRAPQPSPGPLAPSPGIRLDPVAVSGTNALGETARFIAIAPRPAGSEGMHRAADHLLRRLRTLGLEPEMDVFTNDTPAGPLVFRNLTARIPATEDTEIVLVSHVDTKEGLPDGFIGANDSGSSTGVLLDLARVLRSQARTGPAILLAFVDGEESVGSYGPRDGLHGSRRLLARLTARDGGHGRIRAVIVLDMIGDRDLTVTIPQNSSPELVSLAFQAAAAEGIRPHFSLHGQHILDDHEPFLEAGIPSIDLIDFEYGSRPRANDYWHTSADTLDKLSAESLGRVGRVVVRMINALSEPRR